MLKPSEKAGCEEDLGIAPSSETGTRLGDREADARRLLDCRDSGGRGGSGDGAGNIEVCLGDLQEPFDLQPRCFRSRAESDDNENLAGGRESGAALHKRDREDNAELTVLHYICPDIVVMILYLLRVLDIALT